MSRRSREERRTAEREWAEQRQARDERCAALWTQVAQRRQITLETAIVVEIGGDVYHIAAPPFALIPPGTWRVLYHNRTVTAIEFRRDFPGRTKRWEVVVVFNRVLEARIFGE
jgi:hypothetical protein